MISRSADFESAASTDFAIQAVICGAQCETWTHKSFDSSFWDYSVYRFRQSRWCPFTESNYELIITSDLLCHLTKRALAGVAGIGPAHVRVKVWCLTSWLHPKIAIAQGYYGGETGIRTLEGRTPLTVFKTAAFDRSAISPKIHRLAQNVWNHMLSDRFRGQDLTAEVAAGLIDFRCRALHF